MRIKFNPAISLSLLYKAWQAGAGLATIPLIIHSLEPAAQGFYYTFASLIAMQSFFELGLGIVISIFASHEWYQLYLDKHGRIVGNQHALSRLVSLGRIVFVYYGIVSLVFLVFAASIGFYILGKEQNQQIDWIMPWLLHVLFSAISLWFLPFLNLLDGCNQVAVTAKFRLVQSLISTTVLWLALSAGLKLWSIPMFSGISVLILVLYIVFFKRRFFLPFVKKPVSKTISWTKDLFPMQWRLAVQAFLGYLSFPLYTVLIFNDLGAVEAGRMGMTLQIIGGIQSFALVFLIAKAPEFAILAAASGNQARLLSTWKESSFRSLGVMSLLLLLLLAIQLIATKFNISQVFRVLPLSSFVVLSIGALLAVVIQCVAVYLRSHKKELLTPVGVISGSLYGLLAWIMSFKFGVFGIALSYLFVTGLVALPFSLYIYKNNFHRLRS